ncbi:helix-turn-helix domain-containing protein [Streptomyces thinghirensis]|uniref:helix-turn-helix domain-containing protein n=1 Tax=Streptomyces thinghirensis TaxID=551547 RepID=UPI0031ED7D70
MTGLDGERELAAALLGLKERSGLSYRQLGCRVFISSSTLHRYCSGQGVPGEFDLVLRIARECGANPAEPAWAAPDARKAAYPEGARAAPPDDLADWDAFGRALVRHAGARIDAYELWVMANHEHHYNGSVKTLVEMTRRASRIIEELDPDATVVCPSVTKLWTARAHRFLTEFAALGGPSTATRRASSSTNAG